MCVSVESIKLQLSLVSDLRGKSLVAGHVEVCATEDFGVGDAVSGFHVASEMDIPLWCHGCTSRETTSRVKVEANCDGGSEFEGKSGERIGNGLAHRALPEDLQNRRTRGGCHLFTLPKPSSNTKALSPYPLTTTVSHPKGHGNLGTQYAKHVGM